MNLTQTDTSLFKRLRFVLMETSHPGNVGAVARAMKTMGFSELVLINPRYPDVLQHPEAIAFASGAQDILANARIVEHPQQALDDCQFVAAVSARLREFSPPLMTPRSFAAEAALQTESRMAIVFGSERYGLPNELVVNCNVLINVPANPEYSSLNLAQAVQLLAYECRLAADVVPANIVKHGEIGFRGVLASAQEREGMYRHLEQALIAIDFLDPAQPKKLMPRLKRLLSRAELEIEEVNIFRGIAKKILDFSGKR